jgi:ribosomal protein L17
VNWFSVLKIRPRDTARRAKRVRAVARPLIYEAVDEFLANRKEVLTSELRNIAEGIVDDLRTHPDLQDLNPSQRGALIKNQTGNFTTIATYRARELGFIRQPKTGKSKGDSLYGRTSDV